MILYFSEVKLLSSLHFHNWKSVKFTRDIKINEACSDIHKNKEPIKHPKSCKKQVRNKLRYIEMGENIDLKIKKKRTYECMTDFRTNIREQLHKLV